MPKTQKPEASQQLVALLVEALRSNPELLKGLQPKAKQEEQVRIIPAIPDIPNANVEFYVNARGEKKGTLQVESKTVFEVRTNGQKQAVKLFLGGLYKPDGTPKGNAATQLLEIGNLRKRAEFMLDVAEYFEDALGIAELSK